MVAISVFDKPARRKVAATSAQPTVGTLAVAPYWMVPGATFAPEYKAASALQDKGEAILRMRSRSKARLLMALLGARPDNLRSMLLASNHSKLINRVETRGWRVQVSSPISPYKVNPFTNCGRR